MIKVGLIGEDPNDTSSIINLLSKKYPDVKFKKLVKGVKGCQLDSSKLRGSLRKEIRDEKFKSIIYIRDLDGFGSETAKVKAANKWFNDLNADFGKNGIFLLNIWELEALIMADMQTFNNHYKTKHQFSGDPAMQSKPKEILTRLTRGMSKRYAVSHCPSIFGHLNIDTIVKNCSYFKKFVTEFETIIFKKKSKAPEAH